MFIGIVLRNEYTTTNLLKELSCIQIVIEKPSKYFNLRALTNCLKNNNFSLGNNGKSVAI